MKYIFSKKQESVEGVKEERDPLERWFYKNYMKRGNNILFEGNFLDKNSRHLMIAQTNDESRLLKKGILLAEIVTPCNNWIDSIIGKYSNEKITAYKISTNSPPYLGLEVEINLRNRILEKELNEEDSIIPELFKDFPDVINFLSRDPNTLYHLNLQENGSWKGKEICYGICSGEVEMELRKNLIEKQSLKFQ